jgi:hypothetical protein
MPRLGPIQREDLIFYLRRLGFDGPFRGRISTGLLSRMLRHARVGKEEWENL